MSELGFHYVGEKSTVLQIETLKDLTSATTLERSESAWITS